MKPLHSNCDNILQLIGKRIQSVLESILGPMNCSLFVIMNVCNEGHIFIFRCCKMNKSTSIIQLLTLLIDKTIMTLNLNKLNNQFKYLK